MKNLKIFVSITVLFFVTSCLTVGKIERNCDKFAQICITDTETVKEIVYRDTTIYLTDTLEIKLPADTVTITDTIKIVNKQAFLPPVYKEFGLIGVNAWVNFSVLNIRAFLTDSTILTPVRDTIIIPNAFKQTTTIKTVVMKKKFIPGFYKFTLWFFITAVVILIGWLAAKFFLGNITGVLSKLLRL